MRLQQGDRIDGVMRVADRDDEEQGTEAPEDEYDELDYLEDEEPAAPPEKIVERVEKVVVKKRGFWTMLFGGILVASLGFLVARYDSVAPYMPDYVTDNLPDMPEPLDAIFRGTDAQAPIAANSQALADLRADTEARAGELASQIARTGEQVATLSSDLAAAKSGLSGATTDLTDVSTQLAALSDKLTGIDSALTGLSDDIGAKIAALDSRLGDLDTRLTGLVIPDTAPLEDGIASLKREFAALNDGLREVTAGMTAAMQAVETVRTRLDGIDVRVTTLEKRPVQENLSEDVIAAYERELDAVRRALADERSKIYQKLEEDRGEISRLFELERGRIESLVTEQRERMDKVVTEERAKFAASVDQESQRLDDAVKTQTGRIENMLEEAKSVVSDAFAAADMTRTMQAETNEAKKLAAAQTAVATIRGALEDGSPFAGELAALTDAGVDVPQGLARAAADGVVTQAALMDAFPAAARAALDSDRTGGTQGSDGIGGFLKRQLGARSVTPQSGDGTDAVLSRIEAALKARDLKTALAEAEALSDTAAAEMAGWIDLVAARQAALDGLSAVAAELNSN